MFKGLHGLGEMLWVRPGAGDAGGLATGWYDRDSEGRAWPAADNPATQALREWNARASALPVMPITKVLATPTQSAPYWIISSPLSGNPIYTSWIALSSRLNPENGMPQGAQYFVPTGQGKIVTADFIGPGVQAFVGNQFQIPGLFDPRRAGALYADVENSVLVWNISDSPPAVRTGDTFAGLNDFNLWGLAIIAPFAVLAGPGIIATAPGVTGAGAGITAAVTPATATSVTLDAATAEALAAGWEGAATTSSLQNAALAEVTGQLAPGTLANMIGPEAASTILAEAASIVQTAPLSLTQSPTTMPKGTTPPPAKPLTPENIAKYAQQLVAVGGALFKMVEGTDSAGKPALVPRYVGPAGTAPLPGGMDGRMLLAVALAALAALAN